MNTKTPLSDRSDPLQVLGLASGASEVEIRQRYLELVRQSPPERDASRFREVHAAYQAASDPLRLAKTLVRIKRAPPRPWQEIVEAQKSQPPRLNTRTLLSLGNRPQPDSAPAEQP